ncbi:hypothetical protein L211DRAFT_840845 [Terfezia boudieri ATCC MYA-4762]|uniref:Uncharacterized protein n=1 Tax=Terfezia boudieri ATCC MYA-4762 TaxID=1051890 RepID=A0A3N4LKR1_9PEZI|nr:hypothetical protein L211DRAFT_840845 [Terfezia boudieri ATCC MYA-4762]
MGKKDNLFFSIQPGWNKNKIVVIIQGMAYRTIKSYLLWGKKEEVEKLNSVAARGRLLIEQDKNLPISIYTAPKETFEAYIELQEAALVARIPENEQINDSINVLSHTTYHVSGCTKLLQTTTPDEDYELLFRKERELILSPEPDTMLEVEDDNPSPCKERM